MKAAAILVVYALGLLLAGGYAYSAAPAGANAKTALIVPVACAVVILVCAAMAAAIRRSRKVGMIGIHAGLVLTLVFAVLIGYRGWAAHRGVTAFQAASAEYAAAAARGEAPAGPEGRVQFYRDRGAPEHDKTYLRNTLFGIAGWSLLAFVALLSARPKRADRLP